MKNSGKDILRMLVQKRILSVSQLAYANKCTLTFKEGGACQQSPIKTIG